jgi:hypothetical protein
MILPESIRGVCKVLLGTNTLAYSLVASSSKKKGFQHCLCVLVMIWPGKTNLRVKAQYNWPPRWGTLFHKKGNKIFSIKSSWSKLVFIRRSTVLSLPFSKTSWFGFLPTLVTTKSSKYIFPLISKLDRFTGKEKYFLSENCLAYKKGINVL